MIEIYQIQLLHVWVLIVGYTHVNAQFQVIPKDNHAFSTSHYAA